MSKLADFKRVSPESLAAFKLQRTNIVKTVVAKSLEHPDEVSQHGDQAEKLLTTGLDFTTQALEVSMQLHNVEMLEYQLQWSKDRLKHDKVQPNHLINRFKILTQVIESILPKENAAEINQFVNWLIERQIELSDPS